MSIEEPRPTAADAARVLRAEWQRMREPVPVEAFRGVLRSHRWTTAAVAVGLVAATAVLWWAGPTWAQVPTTVVTLWFVNEATGGRLTGRSKDTFAADQVARVERIRAREAAREAAAEEYRRRLRGE